MKPRSINIFLLDGDPNGIRVAHISMSTIQAIAFRRNQLRRAREAFPEIDRPGVYILIGAEDDEQDRQLAYIGESEDLGARLSYHNSNETGRNSKAFWTDTIVLISKDENLTKSHARYVESCLVRSVGSNPRWGIPNVKTPSDDAGRLPLPERAAMEEFVDQTKTLVGALGCDLFRTVRGRAQGQATNQERGGSPSPSEPRFFYRGGGFDATMTINPSGDFVVLAGSKARLRTTPTIHRGILKLRGTLIEAGILREDDESLLFTNDYSFSSVSAAASVVCGASANGRILWKSKTGRIYADWEAEQGNITP